MIVVLVAIAGAVWAVSVRTRPTFAVYDSVPPPPPSSSGPSPAAPAGSAARAAVAPVPADSTSARARAAQPVRHPRVSHPIESPADTAPAATSSPTDTAAGTDTLRHHRSENYGGYSGYGSRERRGSPNAR